MLKSPISKSACLALVLGPVLVAQQASQAGAPGDAAARKRAMTLQDVMQFEQLRSPVLSPSGQVVAYGLNPDRGDGAVRVHDLRSGATHAVAEASSPKIAADDRWVLATVVAPFDATGKVAAKDRRKNGLALIEVATGKTETILRVESAAFSKDGRFVAWKHFAEVSKKGGKDGGAPPAKASKRTKGTTLVLRRLGGGEDVRIDDVTRYAFSADSRTLSHVICTADGQQNGIFHRDLESGRTRADVFARSVVHRFTWNETSEQVAFTVSPQDDEGEFGATELHVADARGGQGTRPTITSDAVGEGWVLHRDTTLSWSKDGRQLRFGVREKAMEDLLAALKEKEKKRKEEKKKTGAKEGETKIAEAAAKTAEDTFDLAAIREDREVDVWHYRDPLISPNQKRSWGRTSNKSYRCVLDLDAKAPVLLADTAVPDVALVDGARNAVGSSNLPYRRDMTWDGRYRDIYVVDVATGKRRKVLERYSGPASLSPKGNYLVWYQTISGLHGYVEGHWFLRDIASGRTRTLTAGLEVPFANEDHDYPSTVPGYGVASWYGDESAVLINDKFDVWRFTPEAAPARCVTAGLGRASKKQYRLVDLDPEKAHIDAEDGPLLFTSFDTDGKGWGLWSVGKGGGKPRALLETEDKLRIVAKAKDADRLLYTREDYDLYPDLHVANLDLTESRQVTRLDAQREPFLWGTSELISWKNEDGRTLQGAVIKPGNYDANKRYPVLVYYYRFFSQRVHEWNQIVVNHRPCFPYWASNGYVVFLPDIRFDVGHPGHAATKCLVPGIQKLVELGIADEKAIALHGHSWSGYQTAHVITETDIFACAIAGAPVSNMTSAYGGVRWQTGLSRQFQYEKTQSRIGGNLWEARDLYIENSPVFFADKIKTPLLIQFGDEDGAVPWYQGIELYMAMRRLDKPCVFLQYRGEPHHLRKYANKVDYTVRFKEYVDHYCKGTSAPKWIETGEPYAGK